MAMTKTKKRVDPRKILRGLAGRASSRVRGTSWATRWTSSAEQTARGRPGIGLSTRHAHGASSRGQGSLHATLGRCPGRNRIQRWADALAATEFNAGPMPWPQPNSTPTAPSGCWPIRPRHTVRTSDVVRFPEDASLSQWGSSKDLEAVHAGLPHLQLARPIQKVTLISPYGDS